MSCAAIGPQRCIWASLTAISNSNRCPSRGDGRADGEQRHGSCSTSNTAGMVERRFHRSRLRTLIGPASVGDPPGPCCGTLSACAGATTESPISRQSSTASIPLRQPMSRFRPATTLHPVPPSPSSGRAATLEPASWSACAGAWSASARADQTLHAPPSTPGARISPRATSGASHYTSAGASCPSRATTSGASPTRYPSASPSVTSRCMPSLGCGTPGRIRLATGCRASRSSP